MWTRSTLRLLLTVLAVIQVYCYGEDELCPRKEPPPGVLVLKLGSNVVIGCRGDVTVDGVPLVSATVLHKKQRNSSETVSFTTRGDTEFVVNDQTNVIGTATVETSQTVVDSGKYTKAKENTVVTFKPSITQREDQFTSRRVLRTVNQRDQSEKVGGARQEKEAYGVTMPTDSFSKQDEYDDYVYEEEGSRVTRGIKKRTRWTLNGQQVRVGVERGGVLRLPHLSLASAGNYSCYKGERLMSTVNISVGVAPERPTLFCYRKSHTSKVLCHWTSEQPVTPQPICHLLLRKGFLGDVTRVPCSFSHLRCWCAFPVEEGDRILHMTRLCVTNAAGNTTSPEINFKLPDIIKPDPPTKVEVRAVEGLQNMLKVSWSYPSSWKHGFYMLHFQMRYRPQQTENYQSVMIDERLDRRLSWMIFDALPHTQYEIQLQAKDEFDGIWSDWSDAVFAVTWSNNDIHIAPETTTTLESNSLEPFEIFPEGSGGSGEGPGIGSVVIVGADDNAAVWLYVSWVFGLCCFVSLITLTVYAFRHKLRFVSTIKKQRFPCSSLPRSAPPLPPPALSEQLPEEGKSLMSPINHSQQHFLPVQQEEQEGIYLHNTDYFLSLETGVV